MDPDPDPGGQKTCGSGGFGSATLQNTLFLIRMHVLPKGGGGGDGARVLEKAATLRELLPFTQGRGKGEIYITS
jgi:hypothetical protein